MSKKQYRLNITVNKELHEFLTEKSKEELRSAASLAKYYLVKGLESEGVKGVEKMAQ